MELHQLAYFEAVARQQHFTRAARELNVAQPSVSQQIRKLEAELGTPLFQRTRRGAELTEAGRLFLPRARAALQVLAAFTARYPGIAVVFRQEGSLSLVRRLVEGELDVAVVIHFSYNETATTE